MMALFFFSPPQWPNERSLLEAGDVSDILQGEARWVRNLPVKCSIPWIHWRDGGFFFWRGFHTGSCETVYSLK